MTRPLTLSITPPTHRLTVDTYGAQHLEGETPEAARSLLVRLVGIDLRLELGLPTQTVTEYLNRLVDQSGDALASIEPPQDRGSITIVDVATATTREEHTELVREWAASVWGTWEHHRATIEYWSAQALEC